MSLQIAPGHSLLRLTALTPTHCGGSFGSAAVDRAVALDVWNDLPYLPGSALKGVVASRYGNARPTGEVASGRQALFGAADDDRKGGGRKTRLVFGDGEPLAFPVVMGDGRRGWVVVASTVYRLAALGFLEAAGLRPVSDGEAHEVVRGKSPLPALPLPLKEDRFGLDPGRVAGWLGAGAKDSPIVVAAPGAAATLWLKAVEERTLTALGADRRVRSGSLRTVELIPPGTAFLSLVTNTSDGTVELAGPALVQLGAWESVGHGYVGIDTWEDGGRDGADGEAPPASTPSQITPRLRPAQAMAEIHRAMETLRSRPEAPRVRSAILDLGPRLRMRGMPATLAFYLAKAGGGGDPDPGETEVRSRDRRAFGWLLDQLFPVDGEGSPAASLRDRVVPVITGEQNLPADFETTRLWLRRHAETMLPKEAPDA